jgi:hypothetical protein
VTQVEHVFPSACAPTADVPHVTEPVCDEVALRVAHVPLIHGQPEPESASQWVGRLRRVGAAKLSASGLTRIVDDAQLLISELVTNALRYGDGKEFEFRLVITLRSALISVNDGSSQKPELRVVGDASETGRGLLLVASIATAWGVTPDGTTTWCTLDSPEMH